MRKSERLRPGRSGWRPARVIGIIVLGFALVSCADDPVTRAPLDPPVCGISADALDFGALAVGDSSDLSFRITNTGTGTLSGVVASSCREFLLPQGSGSFSLGPDQSHEVTVRFRPEGTGPRSCTVTLGHTTCAQVHCFGEGDAIGPVPAGFVRIDAGAFVMGSPVDEPGRDSSEVGHRVTLSRPFEICDHEVTQAEWQEVMGWNDSAFRGGRRPVETLSWYDAIDYCNRRSLRDGRTPAYVIAIDGAARLDGGLRRATVGWNREADGYRLPTEAEWEYVCRAGTASAFFNGPITASEDRCEQDPGLEGAGWYCANAGVATHPVKEAQANPWQLHDLHGNVAEWCWDGWQELDAAAVADPAGADSSEYRVHRGGHWLSSAARCRSAARGRAVLSQASAQIGLRVVRGVN